MLHSASVPGLFKLGQFFLCHGRHLSSASAAVTRIHRTNYLLQYPTKLILSDGSSITVRYHEPRQIIKLPLDLSTLSEEEARIRIERRRPKTQVKVDTEDYGSFNAKKYLNLVKKKK